jgi:hypothetical protein
MAAEKIVTIELPKEEFQNFAAGFGDTTAKSLTEAFNSATAELNRKESRNAFVKYFDLEGGYGTADVTGSDTASVTVDKTGTVEVDMGESEFKKLSAGLTGDAGKALSTAFDAVSADMTRKEGRNAIVNYFDLYSQVSSAPVEPLKNTTLSLWK